MIGPTHYEGWTCNGCEHLKETTHFYCFGVKDIDNRIEDRMHTPKWCPYLKSAIIERIVDDM